MAVPDISAEVSAFRDAAYGEEVREALISLAYKLRGVITSELNDMSDTWNSYKDDVDGDMSSQHTSWDNFQRDLNEEIDQKTAEVDRLSSWSNNFHIDKFHDYELMPHVMRGRLDPDGVSFVDGEGNVGYNLHDMLFTSDRKLTTKPGITIGDANGNILIDIDGTEYSGESKSNLYGKSISFIGDSITTFQGYIPEGYAYFYPKNYLDDVDETWWKQLIDRTGMTLICNASWSGSRVSGDSASTTSASAASSDKRVQDVGGPDSIEPDFIVIHIGTNDFTHNVALGDWTVSKPVPANDTTTTITDAYMLMLSKLHQTYPNAHIFCCTLTPRLITAGVISYPITNSGGLSIVEVNSRIREIARAMNCEVIEFADCGLTTWNCGSYMGDGRLHPNMIGADLMTLAVQHALETHNSKIEV